MPVRRSLSWGASPRLTSMSVVSRRRTAAAVAVAVCLGLDVLGVAVAVGRDPQNASTPSASSASPVGTAPTPAPVAASFAAATDVAFRTGTTGTVRATGAVDSAESVPTAEPSAGPVSPPKVVQKGDGRFRVLAVPAGSVRQTPSSGRVVRYTVETEGGLGVEPTAYARTVVADLTDPRGWQNRDRVKLVNLSPAQVRGGQRPDLRIMLTSPDTTDRLCAPLQTRGRVSCHNGGRVVLNAKRWLLGADAYGTDVAAYREYLVNHEVGHGIGHGHVQCGGKGRPAPVMMQQTYGLDGCTPWPWPAAKS